MEMESLILTLMDRNPGHVIQLMGNTERHGEWHSYGLQEEFRLKASHITSEEYLTKKIDALFETFPLAVYARLYPYNTNDFIRFSHFAMAAPSHESYREIVEKLDDRFFSNKLLSNSGQKEEEIIPLVKPTGDFSLELVKVHGIIKSSKKARAYKPSKGLQLFPSDKGATAWFFLSSPVVLIHELVGFYYDAFGILQLEPDIKDATLTLYSRDMRTKKTFESETYNFLSAKKIAVAGKPIIAEKAKTYVMPKKKKKSKSDKKKLTVKKEKKKVAKNKTQTRIRR